LLAQIRDLWTHTSTALEGNTLSLGDTHFVLQEGLTISGKPIQDHQEVIGHARAIDLLYRCLSEPLTESIVFELHKSVQTEQVTDIHKPNGAWKVEPNGTHMVAADGRQVFIEYAMPSMVPVLMAEIIEFTNAVNVDDISAVTAHEYYSKIHMGIVHEQRRNYIQLLADYQIMTGQLDATTGVWPDVSLLADFNGFCASCYGAIRELVAAAFEMQKKRI